MISSLVKKRSKLHLMNSRVPVDKGEEAEFPASLSAPLAKLIFISNLSEIALFACIHISDLEKCN